MKSIAVLGLAAVLAGGCAVSQPAPVYPYTYPLNSPGGQFSQLPTAVQRTVHAQTGKAEIIEIRKFRHDDLVVYEIVFRNMDTYPPLYLASDGSVLYPDLTVAVSAAEETEIGAIGGVKWSELPMQVATAIREKAPTAEVAYIRRLNRAGHVVYEVWFRDEFNHPRLWVNEEGSVVNRF